MDLHQYADRANAVLAESRVRPFSASEWRDYWLDRVDPEEAACAELSRLEGDGCFPTRTA